MRSNYAINATPEQALRSNRAVLPARVIAALDIMRKFFAILSWFGFVASMFVFLRAITGTDLSISYKNVWLLQIGVIVIFVPFVLQSRSIGLREAVHFKPRWVLLVVAGLLLNVLCCFLLYALEYGGSMPVDTLNGFVLRNNGVVVRELSETEFQRAKAQLIRGVSAGWLLFYSLPALFYTLRGTSK